MGILGNVSGKEAAKVFARAGWIAGQQVGSHLTMRKPGSKSTLSIPQHKELAIGTLRSLIRSAEMGVDEFLELL